MQYAKGTIVFDGWEIERLIGAGSYGKVYEITKKEYGITTTAALKIISIPQSQTEIKNAYNEGMDEKSVTSYFKGFVDEMVNEILIMSKVKSHNNIVSYEDHKVIEHDGDIGWDILIRMEYLTPFVDYQYNHKMTVAEIVRLGVEISSALDFCHNKGLIHRDVKPENIFVNDAGVFKIGDFGVAKTIDKTTGGMSKKGTESYMAPEVYIGKTYGTSVDTYSLGLVLYRLLNGNRLPFLPLAPNPIRFEDREKALVQRIRGDAFAAPIQAETELAEVVLKACAYQTENRYKNAGELCEALKKLEIKFNASYSEQEVIIANQNENIIYNSEILCDEEKEGTVGIFEKKVRVSEPIQEQQNNEEIRIESVDRVATKYEKEISIVEEKAYLNLVWKIVFWIFSVLLFGWGFKRPLSIGFFFLLVNAVFINPGIFSLIRKKVAIPKWVCIIALVLGFILGTALMIFV